MPGIDTHYDMWTYAFAADPMEVLHSASMQSAHMLGLEHQLGSIEVGKLADLVVLNGNPLEDIRQTRNISHVVKGGVVFDGETGDEIWPESRTYIEPGTLTKAPMAVNN